MSTGENRAVWVSAGVRLGVPHPQFKLYLSLLPAAHLCPLVAFLVTTGSALEPGAQGHAGRLQPLCQVFQNCVNLGGSEWPACRWWTIEVFLAVASGSVPLWPTWEASAYSGGALIHQMSLYSLFYEWIHLRGTSCLCGGIFPRNF